MKRKLIWIVLPGLLMMLLTNTGHADPMQIELVTLEQAVAAARAVSFQSEVFSSGEDKESAEGTEAAAEGAEAEADHMTIDISRANETALNVALTVIDLDFSHKKLQYLETRQEALQLAADKADMDFKTGKIDAGTRDDYKKEAVRNSFDLNHYKMQIENGEKSFKRMTGLSISKDFQYDRAYLIADAGKLPLPASFEQSAEAAEIEKKLSEALTAYGNLGTSILSFIEAAEKLEAAQKDFETGKADKELLEILRADKEKLKIDALEGKAVYSKLLYELDYLLEGYISADVKKIEKPIFIQQN